MRVSPLVLALAAAPSAEAQSPAPPALPFRAGQWGAQFTINSAISSVGFLRFRSPSSAWVLDLGGSTSHIASEVDRGLGSDLHSSSAGVNVQAGLRSYARVVPQVARYLGAGLLAHRHRRAGIAARDVHAHHEQEQRSGLAREQLVVRPRRHAPGGHDLLLTQSAGE